MDIECEQICSRIVSADMDKQGYSFELIKQRRIFIFTSIQLLKQAHAHLTFIACGSIAEGIVPFEQCKDEHQSLYFDKIGVAKNIICVDESVQFKGISGITLFEVDRGPNAAPGGYAVLKLVSLDSTFLQTQINRSTVETCQSNFVLSSQVLLRSLIGDRRTLNVLKSIELPTRDRVHGFQGFFPAVLRKWKLRPRVDWPSKEVIQQVCAMEAIIEPSDSRNSPDRDVEWRISFTKAENLLIYSMNQTSLKTYVLLRKLFKDERGLTSYHLKTAVFWITEKTHQSLLEENLLITNVVRVLYFLDGCLDTCYLPNYFKPSWNVLTSIDPGHRKKLMLYIQQLVNGRGTLLFQIGAFSVLHRELALFRTQQNDDAISDELRNMVESW